ncbi:MAG: NAD-dependent epimerase/dehydratase family protein [Pseudomonadota bacterium]
MAERVLITGATGMVGRNLVAHPAAHGHEVLAPPRAELDLTDAAAVADYVAWAAPTVVIHAAGKVGGIQANMAAPVDFLDVNTMIGRNVLMAARAARVPRLVNLSSSCVYPARGKNPLTEDQIGTGALEPTNEGYALAKVFAMRLAAFISAEDPELSYKTLIPCNLFGPWDAFSPGRSHLLPAIIDKLHRAKIAGKPEADIWGDGTARREFMYVGDAAEGIWRAVDHFDTVPDVMNLGVGRDHSVNDYYAAVAGVLGWVGRFTHDLSKPVGMAQKLTDVSRQTAWGWAPATPLSDAIARTYDFYREHHS